MAEIFKFLQDEEFKQLVETAERRSYQPKDVLIREGDEQTSIFILRDGKVNVVREHVGFQVPIATYGPGEIFGEMSFIEGLPASATVVAEEASEAVVISNRQLLGIIRDNPGFYGRFYHSLAEILSRRVRLTNQRISATQSPWGDG